MLHQVNNNNLNVKVVNKNKYKHNVFIKKKFWETTIRDIEYEERVKKRNNGNVIYLFNTNLSKYCYSLGSKKSKFFWFPEKVNFSLLCNPNWLVISDNYIWSWSKSVILRSHAYFCSYLCEEKLNPSISRMHMKILFKFDIS